ncbi:hypothetical protein E9993_06225 [Labilibacter sediminis]|nr:hypothetical protein E9993_06225 [Labilibacter sediminis]
MKKIITILAGILITSLSFAQEPQNNDEIKTIFNSSSERSNGGYGALMFNYSKIAQRDALLMGAKGGWVINHSFTLGAGGYGFITEPKDDPVLNKDYEFAGGYGGLLLEPIVGAKKPVHLSFPILIGAGGIAYITDYYHGDYEYSDQTYEDSDAFFVVEPGIEIEFNMVKFMRVAITGSYRYTSNINLNYKTPLDNNSAIGSKDMLCGWNVGMAFKFGKF